MHARRELAVEAAPYEIRPSVDNSLTGHPTAANGLGATITNLASRVVETPWLAVVIRGKIGRSLTGDGPSSERGAQGVESTVRDARARAAPGKEDTMTALARPTVAETPDWVVAEMPPGYQTRMAEIQRLSEDLHAMDEIARVLWQTGEPLKHAVRALVATLKCEVESAPGADGPIAVKLDTTRRLLLHVAGPSGAIQKTSEDLANAFQILQFADDRDRVVLVANADAGARLSDRPDPVMPDALKVVQRMGLNVLETSTLFRLWRLSMENQGKARTLLERLHAQDGGPFVLS